MPFFTRHRWCSPAPGTSYRLPFLLTLILLCLFFTPLSHAASVTLAWDAPASGAVTGYKLHRGTVSKTYTTVTTVGGQPQTLVDNLVKGTRYYFAVTAYNSYGESDYSNEIAYTVPANQAPVAGNSSISTKMNTRVYKTLKASDADGDKLTYTIVTNGAKGRAVITNSTTGAFYYAPYWNRTGSDSFTFRVSDGKLNSSVAKVSVTITTAGTTSALSTASPLSESSQGPDESLNEEAVLLIEAEDGEIRGPMTVQLAPDASAGSYLEVSAGAESGSDSSGEPGTAEYVFDVPVSGTYAIWGRVQSRDSRHNGFYLRVDSEPFVNWETGLGGEGVWIWSALKAGSESSPLLLMLEEGRHVLTLKQKDDGTRIDQILITGEADHFGSTLYEDAEDRTTRRWRVASDSFEGAEVSNVFDVDCKSRVIELHGTSMHNQYRLVTDELKPWSNESRSVLEWSMKSSHKFSVQVDVDTTEGSFRLVYSPVVRDGQERNGLLHLGLGSDVLDGRWHTFVRDLQADLQRAHPNAAITRVNGFAVRGGGRVDNVSLR